MVGYKAVRLRIDTTNVLKLVSRSFEDRIGDKVMVFDLYPKYVQQGTPEFSSSQFVFIYWGMRNEG